MEKIGCNKQLNPGDKAVCRWGRYLCLECDQKHPAPFMAVYSQGVLTQPVKCGEIRRV